VTVPVLVSISSEGASVTCFRVCEPYVAVQIGLSVMYSPHMIQSRGAGLLWKWNGEPSKKGTGFGHRRSRTSIGISMFPT